MATCVRIIADGTTCGQKSQGDRCRMGSCRIPRHGVHHRLKMMAKKRRKRLQRENERMGSDQRGVSVAGIHKVSASSKESIKKKVTVTKVA